MIDLFPGNLKVLKPLVLKSYEELLYPKLKQMVEASDNEFDDHALNIFDGIVKYFL